MAFVIPPRSLTDDDGLGTVFGDDLLEFVGHRIEGFIPRNALPARRGLSLRMSDPVRMVCLLCDGQALAAQRAVADGRSRVALDLDHPVVLDGGDDAAAPMATAADRAD